MEGGHGFPQTGQVSNGEEENKKKKKKQCSSSHRFKYALEKV